MQNRMQTTTQPTEQVQFQSALDHLRNTLLLPTEFALRVSNGELQSTLPDDWNQSAGPLARVAFSLGKAELESCLIMLVQENSDEVTSAILKIIELRMSPRLVQLIWALTQYFYRLPDMRKAARLAANSKDCGEEMLKVLFSWEQDYIGCGAKVIIDHDGIISDVIERHNIILDSPLTNVIFQQFFLQATEREFLYNQQYFVKILNQGAETDLLPVIINYLAQPWMNDSSKSINMQLRKRFGMPEDGKSAIWANIPEDLITRYRQLVFLNMMAEFFGMDSRKYTILSKFRHDITAIRTYHNKEVMAIDFGQFGIIDTITMKDHSLLLEKATMEITLENLNKQDQEGITTSDNESVSETGMNVKEPIWSQRKTDIQARDVIIEEKSSDVLVLEMSGLGKLYTEELMNELLRKGEEHWPVRFKQAIARFKR